MAIRVFQSTERRLNRVAELMTKGASPETIMKDVGFGVTSFYRYLVLVREMNLVTTEILEKYRKRNWNPREITEKEKEILNSFLDGVSRASIAKAFGVSRERIRQIIESLRKRGFFPDKIAESIPVRSVAKRLGISENTVRAACNSGLFDYFAVGGRLFIHSSDFNDLLLAVELLKERRCLECGKYFVPEHHSAVTCSNQCKRGRQKREYRRGYLRQKSENALSMRIKACIPDPNCQWVTINQACKLFSLTRMQLDYLIRLKVLATSFHQTKKWRGRPVKLVAKNQVEFVQKVYSGKCII